MIFIFIYIFLVCLVFFLFYFISSGFIFISNFILLINLCI